MLQPSFDCLYEAISKKSAEFDGLFFTGVKTTGIFCRPICPAKTPFSKNVEFFDSPQKALHAGYRACKRCKPLDMGADAPEWIEKLTNRIHNNLIVRVKDQDLREIGLDPIVVRRVFLKRYGMTFHAYQRALRLGQALKKIRNGADAVDAAIMTGYESESGFREAFQKIFETTPQRIGNVKTGWAKWVETPLGPLLAVAFDEGLALLEFVDRRMLETQIKVLMKRFSCTIVPGNHVVLDKISDELSRYFDGNLQQFETPIAVKGTDFQERVWKTLGEIPYGETRTYAWLAKQVGSPGAARAVGTANGDNRLAIIIPCHRIINSSGELGGYGGLIWRKKRLLELESGGQFGTNLFDGEL